MVSEHQKCCWFSVRSRGRLYCTVGFDCTVGMQSFIRLSVYIYVQYTYIVYQPGGESMKSSRISQIMGSLGGFGGKSKRGNQLINALP